MFLKTLVVERIAPDGDPQPVPIYQLDSFAMRNFTNNAVFDDTLPVAEGQLQAGSLVPLDQLQSAMEQWFHRKRYLQAGETLRITETRGYFPHTAGT